MIDFGSSTFCNAGVLEFTAGSAELCRDREPGIAAVAGGSFWSQSSNIAEKRLRAFAGCQVPAGASFLFCIP